MRMRRAVYGEAAGDPFKARPSIAKASRSKEVADAMTCMIDDLSERSRLISPMFYLRLLAA